MSTRGPGKAGKEYPHLWVSGPDPEQHRQYLIWLQQRNQAQFRGEPWQLPFELWQELWRDRWAERGRRRDQYCMSRRNWLEGWTPDNIQIITRAEHSQLQTLARNQGHRSPAQQLSRQRLGLK